MKFTEYSHLIMVLSMRLSGAKVDTSDADAEIGYNYVIFGGDVNSLVYDAYKRIDEFNALGLNK